MKKRLLAAVYAGIAGAVIFTAGAAGVYAQTEAEQTEAEQTEAEQTEKTEQEIPAEDLKVLGEKKDGDFEVRVKNASEKGIKGISIKIVDVTEYTENLLEENDVFEAEEERMLYFTPAKTEEADDAQTDVIPVYDVQLTFEDDTTAELHTFPFGDVEKCEICLEEDVAYLIFDSISLKKSVNSLQTEKDLIAAAQPSSSQSYDTGYYEDDYYEDDYYEDDDYYYEDDYYEDSGSGDDGSGSQDDGGEASGGDDTCLDGGLLY